MRRRRIALGLGTLVLVGGAVTLATRAADGRPPLHFWARVAEDPPRLCDGPNGSELGAWTVTDESQRDDSARLYLRGTSARDPVQRLLVVAGLRKRRDFAAIAVSMPHWPAVDGWREYLVVLAEDLVLFDEGMVADPDLVGEWETQVDERAAALPRRDTGRVGVRWRLHADGTAESDEVPTPDDYESNPAVWGTPRWGRYGDVLVIKAPNNVHSRELLILDSDRRSARGGD